MIFRTGHFRGYDRAWINAAITGSNTVAITVDKPNDKAFIIIIHARAWLWHQAHIGFFKINKGMPMTM